LSAEVLCMAINYQRELNAEQLRVVNDGNGPCLVLAGAGTGKTRTIVYRVAYLLEQGIDPGKILLVTFTNKASREMLRRVEILLGHTPEGLWGGTFHHVGHAILRRYGSRIGLASGFTILDQDDSMELLKSTMAEQGLSTKKDDKSFLKPEVLDNLISFSVNSARALPELVEEWIPKHAHLTPEILRLASAYEQKKRERNVVSFDDLLYFWLCLLRERPEVRESLGGKFDYILIDEYQDTNRLQGMIVEELARQSEGGGACGKNVLVVGDDAQSIYAFRAATVENIMRFPEVFPGAKIFRLEQNYRSTQAILDLANACIACNRRQFEKELKSACHPERSEGSRPNRESRDSSASGLRMTDYEGTRPELIGCADATQEARFIAGKVLEFHDEGESLLASAVLFRAAYQAMQLELELQKRGVPYVVRGGIRFFEQAHIKDVVAYLKVVANPTDEIAWQRVLKMEEGIGAKTAAVLAQRMIHNSPQPSLTLRGGDIVNIPTQRARGSEEGLQKVLARIEKLKSLDKVYRMIDYLLEAFYENYAEAVFENARERLEDLRQLALFAKEYQELEQFLADATLSEGFRGERKGNVSNFVEQNLETLPFLNEDQEHLVLSTIHQAKGLEWKNVFVVGLIDGQFPHYKSHGSRAELEEERRLFYVAVTRAKEQLFLTYPVTSMGSLGTAVHQPSLFVRELNPHLFKTMLDDEEVVVEI